MKRRVDYYLRKSYQSAYRGKKGAKKTAPWYVDFINPSDGARIGWRSLTDIAKRLGFDPEKIVKRSDAEKIADRAIEHGLAYPKIDDNSLVAYVTAYWDFDGKRITLENKRKSGKIGREYADIMLGYFKNHIKPLLPKNVALDTIARRDIERIVDKLLLSGKLANATVDKAVRSLTKPLHDAYMRDEIPTDPTKGLLGMDTTGAGRGIVTLGELWLIMARLDELNERHTYLAVLLSAHTGMRLGEIRALKMKNIHQVTDVDAIIDVSSAFAVTTGFKSPKGKRSRQVPCDMRLVESLKALALKNTNHDDLIFWSFQKGNLGGSGRPISSSHIEGRFNSAVADVLGKQAGKGGEKVPDGDKVDKDGKQVMIPYGELLRRERKITFHSLRHFFVSTMRGRVPDATLRLTAGHQSEAMTDNYTHMMEHTLAPVADVARTIIPT